MKIAIAPFATTFIDFFCNLASYIELQGHEVHFLNPDMYIRRLLQEKNFIVKLFPQNEKLISFYNEESDLIRYQKRLYNIKDTRKLILHKNQEYSNALAFFNSNRTYDKVLFWNGDSHVENPICKKLNINCMYFENGYFPNTLQLNYSGVNANADYANLKFKEFLKYRFPEASLKQENIEISHIKQHIIPRFFLRLFDPSFSYFSTSILKSSYLKWKSKQRFTKTKEDKIDLSKIGDFIFFPLQVNSDTQIILNSSYKSMYDVLKFILPQLKKTGYKILIKEHPAEIEPVNYEKFIDNRITFLIKKFPIEELIKKSVFTINVNSSVGLQAISEKKPVFTLGNCFYGQAPNVYNLKDGINIHDLLNEINFNNNDVDAYIQHLKKNIFIEGNWRTPEPELFHRISRRILAIA